MELTVAGADRYHADNYADTKPCLTALQKISMSPCLSVWPHTTEITVLNEVSVNIHAVMHTESERMSSENPLVAWGDTRQKR
jgi:hypothetical protein